MVPPRRPALTAISLIAFLSGCALGGSAPESASPSGSGVGLEWTPPGQEIPRDPGYRERLGAYAEFVLGPDAIVPNGSVEHLTFMETCIESAGFDVEIEDGGIQVRLGAQESFYRDVQTQCEADAVQRGLVAEQAPPDDRELAAWYDGYMLTYDCMVREGYPVNPPPSRDSYIESGGQNWHPYELLRGDPSAIEAVCPQDLVVLWEMLASGSQP